MVWNTEHRRTKAGAEGGPGMDGRGEAGGIGKAGLLRQRRQVRRSTLGLSLLAFAIYATFIVYAVLHGRHP